MRIVLCGSLKAGREILNVNKTLKDLRFETVIPPGIDEGITEENSDAKIKRDFLKKYFSEISRCDSILVVNANINNIAGYIGPNTLIEMAFAHVLDKKIFVLNPLPEISNKKEILATKPIILNGKINIKSSMLKIN